MGTTPEFEIPYPEPEDLVYLGANDMQELAEATDDALVSLDSPPVLILAGHSDNNDDDGRPTWDTGTPILSRGAWTFPAGGHLFIPPAPGLFLVAMHYKLDPFGGVSDHLYTWTMRLQSKVQSADQSTAVTWMQKKLQQINGGGSDNAGPRESLSGIVRVDATPNMGIQAQLVVPEGFKAAADTSARIQVIYLGRP